MRIRSSFTFSKDSNPLVKNPVLITGVNRSGTTITGKIVGSFEKIEYEYEPWLLGHIPVLLTGKLIDENAALESIKGFCSELLNDRVLGRGVNCRPGDDSAIWNLKPAEKLIDKWLSIKSRDDVKKAVKSGGIHLCCKVVNVVPFIPFFFKAYPDIKVLHIIRSPFDTAMSIANKGWMSEDHLKNNEGASISKQIINLETKEECQVPWWVRDEDVDSFLSAKDFERGLCCWRTQMESLLAFRNEIQNKHKNQYLELKFEDFVASPQKHIKQLERFVGGIATKITEKLIAEIDKTRTNQDLSKFPLNEVSEKELSKIRKIMAVFGYTLDGKNKKQVLAKAVK